MTELFIDTRESRKSYVCLSKNGGKHEAFSNESEGLLKIINKVLIEAKITVSNIDKVTVSSGPGSFTGLRVGLAIGNALSFSLLKPVNNKKLGQFEKPSY